MNGIFCQWRKSLSDIRNTCAHLQRIYQKENEKKKQNKRLKDIFPFPQENEEEVKNMLEDFFFSEFENKPINDELKNFPIHYPKLLNDSGDFYAQYKNSNLSIMKKRPYESGEYSTEGPSPKRPLISRQNLIKTKSPVISKFVEIFFTNFSF